MRASDRRHPLVALTCVTSVARDLEPLALVRTVVGDSVALRSITVPSLAVRGISSAAVVETSELLWSEAFLV